MSNANKIQVGGTHYQSGGSHQHWDLFADMPYLEGYASKYLVRWNKGNGITKDTQDLEKVRHIITKILELHQFRSRTIATVIQRQNPFTHQHISWFCDENKMTSTTQRAAFAMLCMWETAHDLTKCLELVDRLLQITKRGMMHVDNTGQKNPFGYEGDEHGET